MLLATDEDEAAAANPEAVRIAVDAVEPKLIVVVRNAEHLEVAVRVSNGLHRNEKPLAFGLVLVLQAQLWTDFIWAQVQAELLGSLVDFFAGCTVLEAEFGNGNDNQLNFYFFGAHREGGLTEDVIAPVADFHSRLLDGFAEIVGGFGTTSQLDGSPRLPDLCGRRDEELARQEALNALHTAKLVHNGFHRTPIHFRIFHFLTPSTVSWDLCIPTRDA